MECAQVTEEQRLWTETQIQKAKHNAWPSCLASVYLTNPPVAASESGRGALPPPLACGSMGSGECSHFPLALAEGVTPLAAQRYIVSMYNDTACAR